MANGWERLLRSIQEKTSGDQEDTKKPEAANPDETPQDDNAVVQADPPAKRTRKTKSKAEQQVGSEQDV